MKFLERGTFGIFPAQLCKGLPPTDQAVLAWLWFHANTDTGECWPSVATLSVESGVKRSLLYNVLARLLKSGLIEKRNRFDNGMQKSNMYRVMQNPDFAGVQLVYSGVQFADGGGPASGKRGSSSRTQNIIIEHNQGTKEGQTPRKEVDVEELY